MKPPLPGEPAEIGSRQRRMLATGVGTTGLGVGGSNEKTGDGVGVGVGLGDDCLGVGLWAVTAVGPAAQPAIAIAAIARSAAPILSPTDVYNALARAPFRENPMSGFGASYCPQVGTLETAFTRLVGCDVPIQLAGMGSILSPELAAAVSNAGALGQITFAGIEVDDAKKRLERLCSLTSKPFGVNLVIPYFNRQILEMAVEKAKVIDFFWGDPDPELIRGVHAAGALASWQVGSVAEAVAAEKAGCDFIIAQGIEAGGHIRGTLGLLPLLTQVLDKVSIPVLAAGGIGSGRGIAAVLTAGASGVRMGTRFIAATESNAHPDYVRAVISAQAEDSVRTTRFNVECAICPATHGVLRSALEAADAFDGSYVAEFNGEPVAKFKGVPPYKGFTGNIGAMACYAGQSVGEVRGVQPAAEIVAELVEQTEALLRHSAVSA